MSEPFDPVSTIMDNQAYNLEEPKPVVIDEENIQTPVYSPPPKPVISKPIVEYIPFWGENPNVVFNPTYFFEFFPSDSMTFNQKLNAITRTVIIMTALSFLYTGNSRIITISTITVVCIFLLHYSNSQKEAQNEGFHPDGTPISKLYNRHGPIVDVEGNPDVAFSKSTDENPLSNVLLTDYDYNVDKKPAPPSFTSEGRNTILDETKKTVQALNPDQPNIDKRLFNDVTSNLDLEQSMRQFYSTANTTIPNDQGSFAEFCYGDMISSKEGDETALARHNPRYTNY